ncbi:MAG TPA: GAF domain-containing protein [Ginsengibacter sp.]|nr:GAF domain-containing protein [Ginsengibacter sp.]
MVLPVIRNNEVVAVLDVDSTMPEHFDETDRRFLEQIIALIHF